MCIRDRFYPIEALDAFVMGLFKNRQLEVGDRKSRVRFEVFNLERQAEPEFTSRMFFKTLSPMFIEEQLPETRKAIHLSPGNPKFAELLHLNLLDKYRVFYGQEPDPSWPLTRLHLLSEPKPCLLYTSSPVKILKEFANPICKPLIYLKNFADRLAVFIYSVTQERFRYSNQLILVLLRR